MIEETQRSLRYEETPKSHEYKEVQKNEEPVKGNPVQNTSADSKDLTGRTSYLFAELLICSLLIWSLLFLKDSSYGKTIMDSISHMLSQNINIEPVESVINTLSEAARQIL